MPNFHAYLQRRQLEELERKKAAGSCAVCFEEYVHRDKCPNRRKKLESFK